MKKRYTFLSKNWLRFGLAAAIVVSSLNSDAQMAPVKQWDKTFGGTGDESIRSIKQTSDGGFIMGGSSQSGQTGNKSQTSKGLSDFWIVKIDAVGNKVWDKAYGGNDTEEFRVIQQTTDGGYLLGGSSKSSQNGDKT